MSEKPTAIEKTIEAAERYGTRLTVIVSPDRVEAMRKRVAHAPNIRVEVKEPGGGVAIFLREKPKP